MHTFVRPIRVVLVLLCLTVFVWPSTLLAASHSLNINATGADGAGSSDQPGVACSLGGSGASWVYDYSADLVSGAFSSLPSELDLHLEVHSEATGSDPAYEGAWLPAGQSFVDLSNERGTLTLDLTSGSGGCGDDTFAFDGTTTSGSGIWSVAGGTDSYRDSAGSGSFSLEARVGSGNTNPFQLQLAGNVAVLDPSLAVEVASATWDRGVENGFRQATVTYQVTNSGPGDAFSVRLLDSVTTTPGVQTVGPLPQDLPDLASGEAALVQVRYQFDKRQPCNAVERGCGFDVTLSVRMLDALDASATHSTVEHVRVPTSPQG